MHRPHYANTPRVSEIKAFQAKGFPRRGQAPLPIVVGRAEVAPEENGKAWLRPGFDQFMGAADAPTGSKAVSYYTSGFSDAMLVLSGNFLDGRLRGLIDTLTTTRTAFTGRRLWIQVGNEPGPWHEAQDVRFSRGQLDLAYVQCMYHTIRDLALAVPWIHGFVLAPLGSFHVDTWKERQAVERRAWAHYVGLLEGYLHKIAASAGGRPLLLSANIYPNRKPLDVARPTQMIECAKTVAAAARLLDLDWCIPETGILRSVPQPTRNYELGQALKGYDKLGCEMAVLWGVGFLETPTHEYELLNEGSEMPT